MSDPDDPVAETVTLTVPEMDCPSCAEKVERSVRRLDGISDVSSRPTTGRLAVTFDPARTDRAAMEHRVRAAGYRVAGEGAAASGPGDIASSSALWTSAEALRVWIGGVFVLVGLALAFLLPAVNAVVATVLATEITVADVAMLIAIGLAGLPVVRNGYYSARNLNLDIDLLMGSAILGAMAIGLFEEAATLAVLFSIAELLEQYAMERARDSLRELTDLSPDEATIKRNGTEVTVPVDEVDIGDVVVVRPGDRIPVDGEVIEGTSAVDEAPVTGESVPVDKSPGSEVFAGTIVDTGYLEVRATATAAESTIAQVIQLVEDAESNRTRREQFVERFAAVYTPVVVSLALLTMAIPPVVFGLDWQTWFVRGLTLLVISCPCAFVISTPVSVVSAITSAAKTGVLIKGGNHLEAMGSINAIALDKTGTLTTGNLTVTDVEPLDGRSRDAVLAIAAGLEQRSEHPIATAILDHASDAGVDPATVESFEALPGKGVRGTVDGETFYAGNPGLFAELRDVEANGGSTQAHTTFETGGRIEALQSAGKTVVLVGTATDLVGAVALADEVRDGAARAVERLQAAGLRVVMLTGDNERTAASVASTVGIADYRAELLPAEKVTAIESIEAETGSVAMVGDGVNDAPALAAATVGVAMGAAGTDTAIETADIALLGDDLSTLPYLYSLSHKANAVIRENIWSSLGVKFLLALGVPFGYVGVAVAVLVGDMGMSLGVTGNALRLSRLRPDSHT